MRKTLSVEKEVSTFDPSAAHKLAREIMGKNMFGIEEAMKYYYIKPLKQQLADLVDIPFTEEVLKSCKGTHVLAAVFPLSTVGIRDREPHSLFYGHGDAWYYKQSFTWNIGKVGWQLVRKEPVVSSLTKDWDEQQVLLGKEERTPITQIMVYTIIGHYLATGERLFEDIHVRCSDFDGSGCRACVGDFGPGGRGICVIWDSVRRFDLGLSSVRNYSGTLVS